MTFYIGRHLSVAKIGVMGVIKNSIENGLLTAQIFVGSPQSASLSKFTDQEKNDIKNIIKNTKFKLICHGKYILNLSKDFNENSWTIKTLKEELKLADSIGCINLVIHMGKKTTLTETVANENFINSIKYICKFIKENNLNIKLTLETSASSGTELYGSVEEFCKMFNNFTNEEKKYLNICFDTAHIWAANHDLNNDTDKYLDYIKKNIGYKYIGLIHLNNSKVECGSRIDRHENLKENKGFINYNTLIKWSKWGLDNNIPIILETPNNDNDGIKECIELIKDLKV